MKPVHEAMTGLQMALKAAVDEKDAEAIEILLESNVRIDHVMGIGAHPLLLAASYNLPSTVERLRGKGGIDRCYWIMAAQAAAEHGHGLLVRQILGYGFSQEEKEKADPALGALLGGHLGLLKEFLREGYRTDLTSPDAMRAIIENDRADILDFMIENGADLLKAKKIYEETAGKFPHLRLTNTEKSLENRASQVSAKVSERHLDLLRRHHHNVPRLK